MGKQSGVRAGQAFVELTADKSKLVAELRAAEGAVMKFARQAAAVGATLTAVGAAILTPFIVSTKIYADLEKQMSRVKALTGATEQQLAQLEDRARSLGKTTAFTAAQAAEAMSFFALAGFDTAKILDAIGPTLSLAAAGQMEIAAAADITAKVMAGLGIEAKNVGQIVDIMAKAMTTANTDLEQLGAAMKFVGPIAKTAGVGTEELVAVIQLLSNAGIQGEMAGTTLRGMLLSLASPSAEAAAELDRLGVKVKDEAGNFRKLADIIGDLEAGLAGSGTGDRLASLGQIFDARQAAGAAELIGQGADRLRAFTAALNTAAGTAGGIAATQLDNLTGEVTILKSVLEGLATTVGESVAPAARAMIAFAGKAAGAAEEWAAKNQTLLRTIAAAGALIGGLGVTLLAISGTTFLVAKAIAAAAAALQLMNTAWRATTALLAVLALNPLTLSLILLSAAIAATTYALYRQDAALRRVGVSMADRLRSGDAQRSQDQDHLRRLQALAAQELRNAGQMDEAAAIIAGLTSRYGDLGLSVNAVTGEIEGLTEAQERLNAAMVRRKTNEIDAAIGEERARLSKLQDRAAEFSRIPAGFDAGGSMAARLDWWKQLLGGESEIPQNMQEQLAALAKIRELEATRKAMTGGDASALTGPGGEATTTPAEQATARAGKLEKDWAERLHALKLSQIKDQHTREMDTIQARYAKDAAEAKAAGANQATLDLINEFALAEVRQSVADEEARVAEEKKRAAEEQAAIEAQIADQQYTIDRLNLQTQHKGIELETKLLDLEKKRAIEAAKAAGLRSDLVEQEYALRLKLLNMEEASRQAAGELIIGRGAVGAADARADLQGGVAGIDREKMLDRILNTIQPIPTAVARIDRNIANLDPTYA